MKLLGHVQWVRGADGPGYLFDSQQGSVVGLNSSSALILELLAEGADEESLVAALVERCGAGELEAREDAAAFLETLMELKLVRP